ncbi:YHS domain-containing (seleno)protein [Cohaesibacter sp. CAU 1516]|uniref:YHS domain-containing (seleno)protein n=1 Tax=Cohaesibacter sp. CAU 1516 TaxID=2576038 RepID=UPI001AEE43F7|nr:YHS domain-containing (seleno)protein [Cohaesibacter sp. CAU 1516]
MKILNKIAAGALLSLTLATSALAAGPQFNTSNTGLALQGYDPVAYFTMGKPTEGSYKITAVHQDVTYRFASEEHKAAFEANPDKYLPQYGGFCAFGASMGYKFDGDPENWKIVDGELYLNLSDEIQAKWETDIPGYIVKADDKWTKIVDKKPSDL